MNKLSPSSPSTGLSCPLGIFLTVIQGREERGLLHQGGDGKGRAAQYNDNKYQLADISNAKCFIYQSSSKTADVWSAIKENQNWPISFPIFHKLTNVIKIQFCKIVALYRSDGLRSVQSSSSWAFFACGGCILRSGKVSKKKRIKPVRAKSQL